MVSLILGAARCPPWLKQHASYVGRYHVVAINSVSDISWGIEKSASLSLFFGTPLKMPDSAIQALGAVGGGKNRWHDVTAKKIRGENRADHLYTHFAWVLVGCPCHCTLGFDFFPVCK
jgi:hypothetical protein